MIKEQGSLVRVDLEQPLTVRNRAQVDQQTDLDQMEDYAYNKLSTSVSDAKRMGVKLTPQ